MLKIVVDCMFIAISLIFLIINIYCFFKKHNNAILYIYPLIFIFNILPTIIHILFGQADYLYFENATIATRNFSANVTYEIIMIIITIFLWFFSFYDFKKKRFQCNKIIISPSKNKKNKVLNYMLVIQTIPIILALVIPSYRGNFLSYGARYTVEGVVEIPAYILGISTIAFLYFLLNTEKKYVKKNILSVILMIITIYLRGSRAIIATVFAMGFYALILSNKLNFKKALKIILILIPIFMIVFYGYHLFFRNASESFYSYYSIDFSRDYTTIFSIYAHQNGINILEYPGQSFIFCLLFWLPRSIFPWKPYPFATYITLALLGSNINNVEYLSLRTTTNIFSESIANFGIIFGTIFIIIIIVLLIKSIDKVKNINFKFLLIYLAYEIMILDFANWVISFGFMTIIILLIEYENVIRDRIKEGINYVKSKI